MSAIILDVSCFVGRQTLYILATLHYGTCINNFLYCCWCIIGWCWCFWWIFVLVVRLFYLIFLFFFWGGRWGWTEKIHVLNIFSASSQKHSVFFNIIYSHKSPQILFFNSKIASYIARHFLFLLLLSARYILGQQGDIVVVWELKNKVILLMLYEISVGGLCQVILLLRIIWRWRSVKVGLFKPK